MNAGVVSLPVRGVPFVPSETIIPVCELAPEFDDPVFSQLDPLPITANGNPPFAGEA